jgi:RNA polymerase sigma-70 factor (ECF subfamily)
VDEVLQEIALAAVAQRSPLLDRALVGPWLYRLVVVHAFRYRRSQARQRNRLRVYQQRWVARDGEGVTDGGNANPLQLLLRSERRELTAEALRQLPPRDAEILMLKYGERWSYSRIAEYLGIRITSVESRLHRARERLRAALHDRLGD